MLQEAHIFVILTNHKLKIIALLTNSSAFLLASFQIMLSQTYLRKCLQDHCIRQFTYPFHAF